MEALIMGLLAETSLHPGSGQSTGAIDLPVSREAATGYPVVIGSSLKGALREKVEQERGRQDPLVDKAFGKQSNAGMVLVTDARLLLLPIRSLSGHFRWVTCPYILERLERDLALIGRPYDFGSIEVGKGEAALAQMNGSELFLEEISFKVKQIDQSIWDRIVDAVAPLIRHERTRRRLERQLVIINDDDFSHFAKFGLAVQARNQLDNDTKESKNLWYEETLPPDTVLYGLLISRTNDANVLQALKDLLVKHPYLQVGGNETIGQGWCITSIEE